MIEIVYHIAFIGKWYEIAYEQLVLLQESGLGDACEKIHVSAVGEFDDRLIRLLKKFSFYYKVELRKHRSLEVYESLSLAKVKEVATLNPNAKILYFHTKGASHGITSKWSNEQIKNLTQWRHFMDFFNITKWRDCVTALNQADVCGVDWIQASPEEPGFFAGNYWWTTGAYIQKCKIPTQCCKEGSRFKYERFIGTGQPKVKNLFLSAENYLIARYLTQEEINERTLTKYKGKIFNWIDFFYEDKFFKH